MGRKKGYSPGFTRKITHRIGAWSWDADSLLRKQQPGADNECWTWTGSKGPQGNLFGAFKNDRAQMTQANRLIYSTVTGKDAAGIAIKMRCANKHCCNPNHFFVEQQRFRLNQTTEADTMFRLTIAEHQYSNLTTEQTDEIKAMAKELAHNSGIDWQWEYRWMIMPASSLLVAQLKYARIMSLFKAQQIV